MVHTGIRAYAFNCSYGGSSWLDDPSSLLSDLQTALSGVSNFSYAQLKVANLKNASGKNIEIEIMGITYVSKTKLSSSENDSLLSALNTALLTITSLVFDYINICNDIFLDEPTSGWPNSSWETDNVN